MYGSLRQGFNHPAYQYISAFFSLVGPARVKGLLYDMGDYPAAIPANDDEHFIVGELYSLRNPDEFGWAIGQIDDYEGVNVELGELPLYKRSTATVFCNGLESTAWVYWYNGDVSGHSLIASGDVLQYHLDKNRP